MKTISFSWNGNACVALCSDYGDERQDMNSVCVDEEIRWWSSYIYSFSVWSSPGLSSGELYVGISTVFNSQKTEVVLFGISPQVRKVPGIMVLHIWRHFPVERLAGCDNRRFSVSVCGTAAANLAHCVISRRRRPLKHRYQLPVLSLMANSTTAIFVL